MIFIVAPRWALASYSCVFGKTNYAHDLIGHISWTLQIGNNVNVQRINVERIYTYPQVYFLIENSESNYVSTHSIFIYMNFV